LITPKGQRDLHLTRTGRRTRLRPKGKCKTEIPFNVAAFIDSLVADAVERKIESREGVAQGWNEIAAIGSARYECHVLIRTEP
jgi:hypothetical protein